jgi:hypothetical protein
MYSPVTLSDLFNQPKRAVVAYVVTLLAQTYLQTEWVEDLKEIQSGKRDRILIP